MSKEDNQYLGKVGQGQFTDDQEENIEAQTNTLTQNIKKKKIKLSRDHIKYLTDELLMNEIDAKNLLIKHSGNLDAAVDFYIQN